MKLTKLGLPRTSSNAFRIYCQFRHVEKFETRHAAIAISTAVGNLENSGSMRAAVRALVDLTAVGLARQITPGPRGGNTRALWTINYRKSDINDPQSSI